MQSDQQRPWRTFSVDEKIEDAWLERLNALKYFDLISICQGHADAPEDQPRRRPHFNLRLKDEFAEALINDQAQLKDRIADILDRAFDTAHTAAHFEIRSGFIKDKKGIADQDIILLKVARHLDLLKEQPIDPLRTWFDDNVAASERFDENFTAIL